VNGDWEGCSARQTGWGGRAGDGRRGSDDEERVEVWGGEGEIRGGGGEGTRKTRQEVGESYHIGVVKGGEGA